jgi:cytochrome c-type biogenesis protein CcmH/NrfG
MHSLDDRRCSACGELSITKMRRFIGGWFFIRCPNCRRQLRVDPQHSQRWMLIAAFALIGAAAIAGAAVTEQPVAFVAAGAIACALLYAWEFGLTRRSPLEAVTNEEAREYRRNWALTSVAAVVATAAVAFAVTRL